MTDPRPEPVLDEARIASLVLALVIAVVGVVLLVVRGQAGDLTALEYALDGVLTAGTTLAAYVVPLWRARKARAKVTPLEDPRDVDGEPLVPAGTGGVGGYLVDTRTPGEAAHAAPE